MNVVWCELKPPIFSLVLKMADTEFEEFRKNFDLFPSHLKAPSPFYSIVPDFDDEYSPSSKSDSSDQEDIPKKCGNAKNLSLDIKSVLTSAKSSDEDDEIGDGLRTQHNALQNSSSYASVQTEMDSLPFLCGQTERRRRKLPEIPKNRPTKMQLSGQTSLAEELGGKHASANACNYAMFQKSILTSRSYLLDENSSPDSERLHSLGDVDSGHSTAHSPTDFKSISPQMAQSPTSPFPPPFGGIPFSQIEMLEATHRGLHKFIPRHRDEVEIEIGDPIYVQKEADDLWCEGVNIRTGRQGIFPSAYAVDLDYNDFDPTAQKVKQERYLLNYLGSVETMAHKGTGVVCQAVRKIVGEYGESPTGQICILEISDQGLRMVDRSSSQKKDKKKPCIDYFYSLKNVSFCAFHPRDHRYIGFITKHPTIQRFACHVFKGHESTRPVAEAVGRAFQHFYQKFIETAYPIEDIYIE